MIKNNGFYEVKMGYTTMSHTVWEDVKKELLICIVLNTQMMAAFFMKGILFYQRLFPEEKKFTV